MDKKTLRTLMVLMVGVGLVGTTSASANQPGGWVYRSNPVYPNQFVPFRPAPAETDAEKRAAGDVNCPCPYNDYACRQKYCQ